MGFLDSLMGSGVRKHAKGAVKAMLVTAQMFNAKNEKDPTTEGSTYEGSTYEGSTYAGIGRLALECRPGWKRTPDPKIFVHVKSGLLLDE